MYEKELNLVLNTGFMVTQKNFLRVFWLLISDNGTLHPKRVVCLKTEDLQTVCWLRVYKLLS